MTTVSIINKDHEITTGKLLDAPYGMEEGDLVIIECIDCNGYKCQTEGKLEAVLED